ncbi:hypothetical protein BJ912DRAFT_906001 [Pholiota molesta]|nr:hypothetical protein BJ912DRAFT_906001 [Pholiota molesta]
MAPFTPPKVVLSGLKEKFDSLAVIADRLYLGSSTGNLHVYGLNDGKGDSDSLELVEVKKGLARRSIEQLGFVKDVNSLVVLSEMTVTLFPLPSLSPATPLLKAKAAFSFAVHSYIENIQIPPNQSSADSDVEFKRTQPIPTLVTQLLIGCRRRAVLYSWKDGEFQAVKEAPLPHSARSIIFLDKDTACFAYSPTEYAIHFIPTMTAVDIVTPLPAAGSGSAMNALTGLTGYMTLGLGAKAKPAAARLGGAEVLIAKDGQGFFVGPDGKLSRPTTIEWPSLPEEIAFVNPYIFSVLPAGTVPQAEPSLAASNTTQPSFIPTSVIQIQSSLSLQIIQRLPFPFNATEATAIQNALIRLMSPSNTNKSPLYVVTTPVDKTTAASEGSSIWRFTMKPWSDQLDELVLAGQYSDALALLDTLDEAAIPDKDQRRIRIRALNAVSQFRASNFDDAIDTFIDLDFNPAKVVALYPEPVAGRLSVPQEAWIPLYGGPAPIVNSEDDRASTKSSQEHGKDNASTHGSQERSPAEIFDSMVTGTGSVGGRLRRAGLGMFLPGGAKEDDTASITTRRKGALHGELNQSIETLVRYLSDRRPKLRAALEAIGITPENQSDIASPLSETSVDDLFALPNAPLAALTPEQLLRFAQIVDTALYKSYLIIRPALLGSLCRIANWCEVTEVEEDLRSRKVGSCLVGGWLMVELRDLYARCVIFMC